MTFSGFKLVEITPAVPKLPLLALVSPGLGIAVALVIVLLFVVVVGGYTLWRRNQTRRRHRRISAAIEAQAGLAPKSLRDPSQRAALDKLRQRFQTGLHEFQSRGKDLSRLPWYLIIGEPGSGKTEAIRHSGIEFPSGLQNELQGSGGTVNMDWWFTDQGIILDTAGRLVFNESPAGESPEWIEFLRLLKKTRYHCPINGLFIVLSIESLIRDSSEEILKKARRLAQQLDVIQKTLEVRFPVYLLVTKSDLLAGFREFFATLEEPQLCQQMFGWSNEDPLDAKFRPELVGEHLSNIAQRLRRRRLALLRESSSRRLGALAGEATSPTVGDGATGFSCEAGNLFALPESILRLKPRLLRYVETMFTTGEWSPKPLFLRGIYFTSSMTQGKTLDEAMAFATGQHLEELPEDEIRTANRAYFLRDLFLDKVFRESGLVTRATNTVRLLFQRRLLVLGVTGLAALLLLGFASLGYSKLKKAVLDESDFWRIGRSSLAQGIWLPPIVNPLDERHEIYTYGGDNIVEVSGHPTLVEYHARLADLSQKDLQDLAGAWIFKPIAWAVPGGIQNRPVAQRVLFEKWMLEPLIQVVRSKLQNAKPPGSTAEFARLRDSLIELTRLEQPPGSGDSSPKTAAPERSVQTFLSFLAERDFPPDRLLSHVLQTVYVGPAAGRNGAHWPPPSLSGGSSLASNKALAVGLETFSKAALEADQRIRERVGLLNLWVDKLQAYAQAEQEWFADTTNPCLSLRQSLLSAMAELKTATAPFRMTRSDPASGWTLPSVLYTNLEEEASRSEPVVILAPFKASLGVRSDGSRFPALLQEIQELLNHSSCLGSREVSSSYQQRRSRLEDLEREDLGAIAGKPYWEARWNFYLQACPVPDGQSELTLQDLGNAWKHLGVWTEKVNLLQADLTRYDGPFKERVESACNRILTQETRRIQHVLAQDYAKFVTTRLAAFSQPINDLAELTSRREVYAKIQQDLTGAAVLGEQAKSLSKVQESLAVSELKTLADFPQCLRQHLGFPLAASATTAMEEKVWTSTGQLLSQSASELANPLWNSRPQLASECERVQGTLSRHKKLMEALTGKDQHIAQMEVSAFPYEQLSPTDRTAVATFRWARIAGDQASEPQDLSRVRVPLFRKSLDQNVRLLLSGDPRGQNASNYDLGSWWLLRSIRQGKAETIEEGSVWRLRVPLAGVNGNLVLQVRLLGKAPLPKPEEWIE